MLSFTETAVTVEEADTRCNALGYADWTGAEPQKAAAILRGQTYIAATYNARWANEWPNEAAPEPVKFAIIEAARRELVTPGSLSPDFDPTNAVKSRSEAVGPLSESVTYATLDSAAKAAKTFPMIDGLLSGLLGGMGGNNFRVRRG